MKILYISMLFTLLLTACASQPAYRPAEGNGYGYKESHISNDRYRVHFKGRGNDSGQAMDFALLRAAELTLQQGYDWFVVVSRETMIDRQRVEPQSSISASNRQVTTRNCGLLGCETRTQPSQEYGVGISMGTDSSEIESILEIRMGKGIRPEQESYDALEIRQHLSSSVD